MSRPIWSTRDRRKLWGEEEDDDDEPEGQGTGGGAEEEVPAASFLGSIPPLTGGWMLRRSDTQVTTSDMRCFRHPTVGGMVLVEDEIKLSINRSDTLFLNNNRNVLQCTILRKSQIECKQFGSKYNQRKFSENTDCTSSAAWLFQQANTRLEQTGHKTHYVALTYLSLSLSLLLASYAILTLKTAKINDIRSRSLWGWYL